MIYTAFQDRLDAIPRPDSTKIKESVFKEMDSFVGTKQQIQDHEDKLKHLVKAEIKNARNEYAQKHRAILDEFKKALADQYGIENDEVNDIVYEEAYENGASGGLHSIECEYSEFIDVAERIFKIGKAQK